METMLAEKKHGGVQRFFHVELAWTSMEAGLMGRSLLAHGTYIESIHFLISTFLD